MKDALFVFDETLLNYKFHDDHPFHPIRLQLTVDLLQTLEALPEDLFIPPDKCDEDVVTSVHSETYINAVKKASKGQLDTAIAQSIGLGTEDTPIFADMHDIAFDVVRASITAARAIAEGKTRHALNLSGGLHHGLKSKAAGFCIYNDAACAIDYLRTEKGWKVLYIDTDAHHGDGVQWSFYDQTDVMTFSIHETGRYLFPGAGDVSERGLDSGYGTCFNLPMQAFTEDDSWLRNFATAIEDIASFFKPDIIVSQHGVDGHFYDPLTHLCLSMDSYLEMPKLIHDLAHKYCDGRWLALGGGGYDLWRVVPRAWSWLWLEMSGQTPEKDDLLPSEFIAKHKPSAPHPLPTGWKDDTQLLPNIPRRSIIEKENDALLRRMLKPLYNLI